MTNKNHHIYVHDMDALPVGSHNCLTVPYTEILKHGFSGKVKYLESPLDLSKYTINSNGNLALKFVNVYGPGHKTLVYSIGDEGVEQLTKKIEAAKAIMIEDKVVDWLLDKKPTIFDKKTIIIATENKDA